MADLERRLAALASAQEALERRIDALERASGREPQASQASGLPEEAQLRTWIAEAVKAELLHREGEAFRVYARQLCAQGGVPEAQLEQATSLLVTFHEGLETYLRNSLHSSRPPGPLDPAFKAWADFKQERVQEYVERMSAVQPDRSRLATIVRLAGDYTPP